MYNPVSFALLRLIQTNVIAKQHFEAQQMRQKCIHDSHGLSECFQVEDRVWLYTPVVPQVRTRKFTSFWKGSYTVIDKPGEVTYKIQLIGGTQTLVVYRNRLKPCRLTPPQVQVTFQHVRPVSDQYPTHACNYTDIMQLYRGLIVHY